MATDFAIGLRRFLTDHMAGLRGCSPNTISSYRDTFKLLICYFRDERGIPPERLTLELIDAGAITGFLAWLQASRHNSPSTRNQRLAAISSFFSWMQSQDPARMACCQDILAIPPSKHAQPAVAHLTVEQTRLLLVAARPLHPPGPARRDSAGHPLRHRRPGAGDRRPDSPGHPPRGARDRRADRQGPQKQARPDRHEHGGAAGRLPRRAPPRRPRPR